MKCKVKINNNNKKKSVLDLKTDRKCSVCVKTKTINGKENRHLCNQHYGHYFLCSSRFVPNRNARFPTELHFTLILNSTEG